VASKQEVPAGTLALMILSTLATLGAQHGYGIARRIEQTSGGLLQLNYGTLYPALIKLEQEGDVKASWGVSENHRRARFYALTAAGRRRVVAETRAWRESVALLARFVPREDPA
jgi:PadR family transcriptional regulator, regulatory protein PadR